MDTEPQGARYVHETPWPAFAMAWSPRLDPKYRLAIGSCIENETNRVQIVQLNEEAKRMEVTAEVEHPFPPTKLMWMPDDGSGGAGAKPDLFASTTMTLNLWKSEEGQIKLLYKLANLRPSRDTGQHSMPPLTSFDWCPVNTHKLGSSSVDTTCTIWNLETRKIETQLIAHDKAVYDIAFSQNDSLFASVGADGSVRLFDQRNMDISTIIYEANPPCPLLRLAWNKININHVAAVPMDGAGVILIDIRRPCVASAMLAHQE